MNAKAVVVFLILNFGALALGSYLMGKGATSEWYQGLLKAPWTPPGWVFGAAWFTIMLCYSFYMAYAWQLVGNGKMLIALFAFQWILNVAWNPAFFRFHFVLLGLMLISALTILIGVFLFKYSASLRWKTILILPYFVWLLIATSLNAFIYLKN